MNFPQITLHPKTGWSPWIYPHPSGYKLECCTCGLVHEFQFRTKLEDGKQRIEFRLKRDDKSTAAIRRKKRKNHH